LGKVREAVPVGLNQPDIERTALVGNERGEVPIRGDSGVAFGSSEVGQPCEMRIDKLILGCRRVAISDDPREYSCHKQCH
jgi:hypothetical protein